MTMFVHDHQKVATDQDETTHWLDDNRSLVTTLVRASWAEHHHYLPPRLDLDGPFIDVLGQPAFSRTTVTFPMVWAIALPSSALALLSGDLSVSAYPDGGSFIELRGTCREMIGWLAGDDNESARPVMMEAVRRFLQSIDEQLSPVNT